MKTFLSNKSLAFALGAVLLLTVNARADDETSRPHHHRPKVHKEAAVEIKKHSTARGVARPAGQIPTRDDRNSQEVTGGAVGGANGPEYRVPTGSHLPRHYNRKGYTTDDDQDTFIYDKNDQRLRSTNNVGDSLRSVPGVSVRGGR